MTYNLADLKEPERLTKERILSKVSQETLMKTYLGVNVEKGLFRNPLRNDARPTCSFFTTSNGVLKFKDFADSSSHDAFSVVQSKYGVSFVKALQIIAYDFLILPASEGYKPSVKIQHSTVKFEEKKASKIQITKQEFSKAELAWWYKQGVFEDTLKKFSIYSCQHVFLNGTLFTSSSPNKMIFGYYGGVKDGMEKWRIYMPKQTYRFLSNWSGRLLQGAQCLPETGEILILSKSMKDVMTLYGMGLNAIATTSENTILSEAQMSALRKRFNRIIVFLDNDLAGVKASNKYKKQFGLECLFINRKFSKDLSDLVAKEKARDKIALDLKKAINGEDSVFFTMFNKKRL